MLCCPRGTGSHLFYLHGLCVTAMPSIQPEQGLPAIFAGFPYASRLLMMRMSTIHQGLPRICRVLALKALCEARLDRDDLRGRIEEAMRPIKRAGQPAAPSSPTLDGFRRSEHFCECTCSACSNPPAGSECSGSLSRLTWRAVQGPCPGDRQQRPHLLVLRPPSKRRGCACSLRPVQISRMRPQVLLHSKKKGPSWRGRRGAAVS